MSISHTCDFCGGWYRDGQGIDGCCSQQCADTEPRLDDAYKDGLEEGAAAERAAIVADIRRWRDDVRSREDGSERVAMVMDMFAWSIERGDHLKKEGT